MLTRYWASGIYKKKPQQTNKQKKKPKLYHFLTSSDTLIPGYNEGTNFSDINIIMAYASAPNIFIHILHMYIEKKR